MSREAIDLIKANPLSDDTISAAEYIGFVIMTLKTMKLGNQEVDDNIWRHLAKGIAAQIQKVAPDRVEDIFQSRFDVAYKNGGFSALIKWHFAKHKLKQPVRLESSQHFENLRKLYITEKQATGYMIFAAKVLGFLPEQIGSLDVNTHYSLRTADKRDAIKEFEKLLAQRT